MSELPGDLLYTKDHEWLRREDDGTVTIDSDQLLAMECELPSTAA